MPLSLESFRRQLRESLGLVGNDTESLPNTDTSEITGADTYLNRSLWEILDKFNFREKEKIATFQTEIGKGFYKIPSSFEALQGVAIEDTESFQHKPLDRITADVFEQEFADHVDARGKPSHYFRESNGIRLWRTPDVIYEITLRYWCELSDFDSSNAASNPPISRAWHDPILFGAIWRAFIGLNGDYVKAQAAKGHQIALLNSMTVTDDKEEFDSHRAGVELPSELTEI